MSEHLELDLLITAEQLLPVLSHPKLRVVDLCRDSVYSQLHISNAVHLSPAQLLQQQGDATGLLPESAKLQALINLLCISPEHHVVVYDDEGGAWASRLIWNLHCAGFYNASLLNGGIHAWLAAGYATSAEPALIQSPMTAETTPFQLDLTQKAAVQIGYDELRNHVQNATLQIWDCRTHDEYTGLRLAARRGGHMPAAIHFEWSTALDRENHLKLKPLPRIRDQLSQCGFDLSQPVVVYCQSHHRSSLAYVLARLLQWPVRAYDGAWSEWGNRPDSLIVRGELPS